MRRIWAGVVLVVLAATAGCVKNSGIRPDGPDGYLVMSKGRTGFSSSASMTMKLYDQAEAFCGQKGLVMQTIEQDSKQARPMGGWPESTLRFRCVARAVSH